ncbi:CASP-like protein 1 [Tanacetum coccineum]
MAPIDTKPPSHTAYDMETTMKWSEPQEDGVKNHGVVDATLRAVLLATTNVALIAMVTSKETKMIPISPTMKVPLDASFDQSPAYIFSTHEERRKHHEAAVLSRDTRFCKLLYPTNIIEHGH